MPGFTLGRRRMMIGFVHREMWMSGLGTPDPQKGYMERKGERSAVECLRYEAWCSQTEEAKSRPHVER